MSLYPTLSFDECLVSQSSYVPTATTSRYAKPENHSEIIDFVVTLNLILAANILIHLSHQSYTRLCFGSERYSCLCTVAG